MAYLLSGKHKGEKVTVHQCCNDWFTVKEYSLVIKPTTIMLTYDEYHEFKEWVSKGQTGFMMEAFDFRFIDFNGLPGVTFLRKRL